MTIKELHELADFHWHESVLCDDRAHSPILSYEEVKLQRAQRDWHAQKSTHLKALADAFSALSPIFSHD